MSSIDFTLFAPTIAEATLIGSFSQWKQIPMSFEHGTFHCSIEISNGEHEYKFRIRHHNEDKWIDVVDPYVTKYNSIKNTGIITIKNGKKILDEYVWKYDDVKLLDNKDLIIYEMYIADFADNGQFSGVIEKLDYINDLGFNAIELLPIQESMGINHEWGYLPRHFLALKTTYGPSTDFKKLIDECHRRKIRVIIDAVFNHTATDCPLAIIDHDYWYYKGKHHPEHPFYWGPELNYEYYDEQQNLKPAFKFATDVVRYWIDEFHLDGIRFDAAKEMDNYDILRELDNVARSVRGSQPFYTAAEYVPENLTIVKVNGGPVDACWSSSFHGVIANNLVDKNKFELDLIKYIISTPDLINYLSCHDNERLLFLLGKDGHLFDDNAFICMRLAMIILFTSVGVPFIFQGDELGDAREWGSKDQHRKKFPMQWNLLKNDRNHSLFNTYKQLIELRKKREELKEKVVNFIHENQNDYVLVYARSQELIVITYFFPEEKKDYEINNIPQNGKWIDWLSKNEYQVDNNILKTNLGPFDGRVLILQK
ncbi:unnamed protein product [Rotaria sordida]|uniref:Glycosyl hydrolase family 13 catalytic domain-containing protein n=1 Tax=Rotaria sordida TaxID=392033 RepID=A0A813WXM5_9BILA|nr:unnamed protein product [Rotaria sordida]CAF0862053.1 unnamed protein product [Rotaria sordida]